MKCLPCFIWCLYIFTQNSTWTTAFFFIASNSRSQFWSSRCMCRLSSCSRLNIVHGGEPITTNGHDLIIRFHAPSRSSSLSKSQPFVKSRAFPGTSPNLLATNWWLWPRLACELGIHRQLDVRRCGIPRSISSKLHRRSGQVGSTEDASTPGQ